MAAAAQRLKRNLRVDRRRRRNHDRVDLRIVDHLLPMTVGAAGAQPRHGILRSLVAARTKADDLATRIRPERRQEHPLTESEADDGDAQP